MRRGKASNKTGQVDENGVVTLLRGIKSGEVPPHGISAAERLNVVEHLRLEGCTIVESAEILRVNEKTVRRDLKKIREWNSIEYDSRFANEMAGMLISTAESCVQTLRRKIRDKDGATLMEIAYAVREIWNVIKGLNESLQSLGFLPIAPQQVQGAFIHGVVGGAEGAAEILAEIQRLEAIRAGNSLPAEVEAKLLEIRKNAEQIQQANAGLDAPKGLKPESQKGNDHDPKSDANSQ